MHIDKRKKVPEAKYFFFRNVYTSENRKNEKNLRIHSVFDKYNLSGIPQGNNIYYYLWDTLPQWHISGARRLGIQMCAGPIFCSEVNLADEISQDMGQYSVQKSKAYLYYTKAERIRKLNFIIICVMF